MTTPAAISPLNKGLAPNEIVAGLDSDAPIAKQVFVSQASARFRAIKITAAILIITPVLRQLCQNIGRGGMIG